MVSGEIADTESKISWKLYSGRFLHGFKYIRRWTFACRYGNLGISSE